MRIAGNPPAKTAYQAAERLANRLFDLAEHRNQVRNRLVRWIEVQHHRSRSPVAADEYSLEQRLVGDLAADQVRFFSSIGPGRMIGTYFRTKIRIIADAAP